ncbi:STE24 endopeptidase [Pelomonas saccharophila]|uniref:STE24 endopeptidase n=1 Tax=Roseateles saccharophilus TaxID=304 RepID=A0ABU1YHE0_ROSSA|nr:M48 family metallopeptidase [Roseateles saccharophilus]MDR7268238.1 STE24 endopeptidase [Roseateles saccharophilus]
MKTWLTAATLALSLTLTHAADAGSAATQAQKADATAQASGFKIRPVDDAWRAALPRNAEAATQAYMDRLPADVVAKSDAYYTGGYWLQLWNLLLGLAVAVLMMSGRRAARVRDWAQRVGKGPLRRDALVGAIYVLASTLLTLPLAVYEGWWREQAYGMSTQTLPAWLGEAALMQGINAVLMALVVAGLYALIRRAGARWWIWGTAGGMAVVVLLVAVSPVLIEPLLNTYKPVEDGPVKTAVLQMAHANGVPVKDVYVFDASRQTTRISANVAGLFGTAAVRLNDNLLRRTSEPEIRAVMGHELGHYVMNHIGKTMAMLTIVLFVGFATVQWVLGRLLARFAASTGVSRVDDVAGLPMLVAVFSVFLTLATPVNNSITRIQEAEADQFGLNLSREPHGFAEGQLKLVEYRKADPGALEEIIFFHHPSTRHRIHDAMRWREAMNTP